MKTVNLELVLPKGLKLADEDKGKTPQELTVEVIKNVILNFGAQNRGLQEEERRLYYKIADKLDEAKGTVELEDQEFGFIKKCFREGKLMPNKLLQAVEDLVEAVPNR